MKLQESIKASKKESVLIEYIEASYKDGILYLGYIAYDNTKNKINCVAAYEISKFERFKEGTKPQPVIYENENIQKFTGIDVPILFIDKWSIPPHGYGTTDSQAIFYSVNHKTIPCIYVTYEQTKNLDETISKETDNSKFIYIWEGPDKIDRFFELNPPQIDATNRMKEYFLKSLYPFAVIVDIPISIPLGIILFINLKLGLEDLD